MPPLAKIPGRLCLLINNNVAAAAVALGMTVTSHVAQSFDVLAAPTEQQLLQQTKNVN